MLSLETVGVKMNQKFAEELWKIAKRDDTSVGLPLAFLGARVCYYSGHPLEILNESVDYRITLLTKLYKAGHHSIFAHVPVLVPKDIVFHPIPPFKTWWIGDAYLMSLRHFTEAIPAENSPIVKFLRENIKDDVFDFSTIAADPDLGIEVFGRAFKLTPECNWLAFIINGLSRCCSHQFVRHTTLNFNQRSNRYTKVQSVLVPESIRKVAPNVDVYLERDMEWYESLVKNGVKKEDARYLFPHGARTVLLVSGPDFIFADFVEKRTHEKAQWEIRWVAEQIKRFLEEL